MGMILRQYEAEDFDRWDDFVLNDSVNGTIFHSRRFLAYHPEDRFEDRSILVFDKNTIAAVFPAVKHNGGIFSHPGTTGGGFVISEKYATVSKAQSLIDAVFEHFSPDIPAMRIPESFFSDIGNDLWLYLLNRTHCLQPELAVYKELLYEDAVQSVSRSRTRSYIRKTLNKGMEIGIADSDTDYAAYYEILSDNLQKFDQKPTHTLDEFISLARLIWEEQRLILGMRGNRILGGIWAINARKAAWHTQYIAKDYEIDENGIMPAILIMAGDHIKNEMGGELLNYGICTEQRGEELNSNLCDFKESLGGEVINRYIAKPK